MRRTSVRKVFRQGVNSYKACSLLAMNTIVVFAFVNVVVFAAYRVKDWDGLLGRPTKSNRVVQLYGLSALRGVYPGYKDDDIRLLMKETWDRGLEYDPFTQFKERAHAGKWVNIDKNGFRLSKNNGSWPPDSKKFNIFLFGGSTTFGYGVTDDQTIASHLQVFLEGRSQRKVKVYNFGSCYFFSTQERTQFLNMLNQGVVPDVVIFIDGLNDVLNESGDPTFTSALRKLFDDQGPSVAVQSMLSEIPITRFVRSINSRIALRHHEITERDIKSDTHVKMLAESLNRYSQNKRLIEAAARAYDVRVAFVWQPIPSYNYHMRAYLSDPARAWWRDSAKLAYTMMATTVKNDPKNFAHDFLWLADIQVQYTKSLYVDSFHYTDEFSNDIAGHIGRFVLDRKIIADGTFRSQPLNAKSVSNDRRAGL